MSRSKDVDKFYMGSSDVVVKHEDEGYNNQCLDICDIGVSGINRELVNLENAAVNIENSSDVIIGPVTQFNVNGNVTIFQNNDGLPLGIEGKTPSASENSCGETFKDQIKKYISCLNCNLAQQEDRRKNYFGMIFFCVLLSTCAILVYVPINKTFAAAYDCYGRFVGNYTIYYREDWGGAKDQNYVAMPSPVGLVIISHTKTEPCDNARKCEEIVKSIQNYHMESLGLSNICYNFLIGGTGDIFVGRGWNGRNCYKLLSVAISFIGDFNKNFLNEYMKESFMLLLEQGLNLSKIPSDYTLIGFNQTERSSSPGVHVYEFIKDMPNFSDIIITINQCRVGEEANWTMRHWSLMTFQ